MKKGVWLVLPVVILALFVTVLPLVNMVYRSFQKTMFGFGKAEFIGLGNYLSLFKDGTFLPSLGRSFIWVFENLAIQLTVPLLIALLLSGNNAFYYSMRTFILIPWVLPMVVISIIWRWILEPNVGILGYFLREYLRIGPINFFGSKSLAFHTLAFINSWHFIPFGTILMLAALSTVPVDLYDAAKVDGASSWQRFVYITFPLIGRTIWFVGLLAFMWSFNSFDLIWLVTQGGPGDTTLTLPVYIYKLAFKMYNYGKASAASLISMAILIGVAALYFKIFSPREGA